jgi:hypothetical protein
VQLVSLSPPNGEFSTPFSDLRSVRELPDGRVLLSDSKDGAILVTESNFRLVRQVGRRGSGPLEYVNAFPVIRFGHDSSIQYDVMARRWLLFAGDSIVQQSSPEDVFAVHGGFVLGADDRGELLIVDYPPSAGRGETDAPRDSGYAVLYSRRTSQWDTIARVKASPRVTDPDKVQLSDYYEGEQAYLASDGWIAVVRLDPFRVDWRTPQGKWLLGAPLDESAEPLDEQQKDWIGRARKGFTSRPDWKRHVHWPATIPPIAFQTHAMSESGELVLRRIPTRTDSLPSYDVIDRQGRRTRRIVLPMGTSILGFGRNTVYSVAQDADGLQWLRRHPWP